MKNNMRHLTAALLALVATTTAVKAQIAQPALSATSQSAAPTAAPTEVEALRADIERATTLLETLKRRLEHVEARQSPAVVAAAPLASAPSQTATAVGPRPPAPVAPAAPGKASATSVAQNGAVPGGSAGAGAGGPQPDKCAVYANGPRSPADATTSGTFDAASASCGRTVAAVLLTGSSGSSGVTVKLSRSTEGGEPDYEKGETLAHSNVYTLTASAPLAKDGPTQLASLDGFATSSKLTFGFTRFMLPLPTDAGLRPSYVRLVQKAQASCRTQAAAETAAGKPLSYKRSCDEDNGVLFEAFLDEGELALMDKILATQTVRRAMASGLEFSVGHEEFKFRDATTLKESDVSRVPLGAKGSLSIFPWPRTSLTAALDYQLVFKAAKSRTFCPTAATTASAECFTGPFAEPGKTEKLITSAEFRKVFDFDKADFIPRLGIAPRVEYDANSEDFAFNLPIYLAPDDKGKLIAGLQAGYTISETDATRPGKERDFRFGLFVGSSFTLP
jgi:hypothetical protein